MATPHPSVPLGTYSPPGPSDTRGPCPMLNTLANHGYLPRDGRNIQAHEITKALHDVVGVSSIINYPFACPIFLVQQTPPPASSTLASTALYYLRHPLALLTRFGMRQPSQRHSATKSRCLNLDQLAFPRAIEHDISLTRRDRAQGDCISRQPDLVDALLSSSTDGQTLSAADLASFRRRRINQQREENPRAEYRPMQHSFACMEIALLLCAFGDGKNVKVDYARAFLAEERLPVSEGWVARRGWWKRLGVVELLLTARSVKGLVGKVEF